VDESQPSSDWLELNRCWWALIGASLGPFGLRPQCGHDLLERWTDFQRQLWSWALDLSQGSSDSVVSGLERAAESLVHAHAEWSREWSETFLRG
jgi:hypothetical protein